jgi:hypothetical protein
MAARRPFLSNKNEVKIMFQTEISGIVFFLIAIFFGPALLMAGFQTMTGQKVRFASLVKPLMKLFITFAQMVFEMAGVVASVVADKLPPKYAHLKPFACPVVQIAIICLIVWFFLAFFRSMAGR